MRKLSELEISPTPWMVVPYGLSTEDKHPTIGDVFDATGESITIDLPTYRDACMMGAAPLMYEALYDAWSRSCSEQGKECKDCAYNGLHCSRWRAALAKAAGESEVRHA